MRLSAVVALLLALVSAQTMGADRPWQTGTWAKVDVSRQVVDFGPGSGSFGPSKQAQAPAMRALADVCVYVIETDHQRIELKEVVQVGRRSVDAVMGDPVTFAVDKGSVWIRDAEGGEHKLRITKKSSK